MSNPVPSSLALSVINTNDPINSAPIRNDFAAVQVAVNQLIACLSGGTVGQRLQAVDGSDVVWANQISYRKTTTKQVVNTVTETDLLNGEITVAANAIGTSGILRLTAWGDSINNVASENTPRFKLKLGATTLLDTNVTGSTPWSQSASRFGWRIVAEIANLGATNSQWATLDARFAAAVSVAGAGVFATGEGVNGNSTSLIYMVGGGAGAVDTTTSQALALTVINPAANALLDVTLKGALVEIV